MRRNYSLQASYLKYNLIQKEGFLKDVYGILDLKTYSDANKIVDVAVANLNITLHQIDLKEYSNHE